VTPDLAGAAAALDRRAFLRLTAIAAGAGLLPAGCGGGRAPRPGVELIVLSPRTYAVFTAAAARLVGPRGAALIHDGTVDPAAAADAILARSPTLAGPLTQGLLALEFGVWPLLPKVRPFTALSADGQDAVIADLAGSTVGLKRALYGGVRSLVMATFYATPASRALTGYPGPFGLGAVTIADAMVPPR
jgi:hypothetical protein